MATKGGKEIGVLGDEAFVLGFQLAGIRRAFRAGSPEAYHEKVDEILRGTEKDLGILIVNAADVNQLPPLTRKRLLDTIDPVVIQIGGESGDLREKVKRAIGIDLYKE